MQNNLKENLKNNSGIVTQFVDVGYSQQEAEFMFEMYFSKLQKYMTPEQLAVYDEVISSEPYKKFVQTNTHFAASEAYNEFLHEALMQETKQEDMKFDA